MPVATPEVPLRMHWGIYPVDSALFLLFTLRRESSGLAQEVVRAFWEGEPLV